MPINDEQILIDRLRDVDEDSLYLDMVEHLGEEYLKIKQEYNDKVEDYLKWAVSRFSTVVIRRQYAVLIDHYHHLNAIVDHARMDQIDSWLDLKNAPYSLLTSRQLSILSQSNKKHSVKPSQKHYQQTIISHAANIIRQTKDAKKLKDLLNKLSNDQDKRKMRRLKRKEAKLKKKGVRLFDSE